MPPLPPGAGRPAVPRKSAKHVEAFKEIEPFNGEPTKPSIHAADDLGKPDSIPQERKTSYINLIKKYKDDANQLLATIKQEIDAQKSDLETIDALKEELSQLSSKKTSYESHKTKMENIQQRNQQAIAKATAEGKAPPAPATYILKKGDQKITFLSDAAYQNYLNEIATLTPEEQEALKKSSAFISEKYTIRYMVDLYTTNIQTLNREITAKEQQVKQLEAAMKARAEKTNNGIPFDQWESLYTEKQKQLATWDDIAKNLSKAPTAAASAKRAQPRQLDQALEKSPTSKTHQDSLTQLAPADGALIKTNPDAFLLSLT